MTSTNGFASVETAAREQVGVRLFTVLAWDEETSALHRVYSSHPVEYPTGGRKVFPREAPWIRRVVTQQQPYLGPDPKAVAAVFEDHALIAALGCGAVVNVPVVDNGQTLGVLNLLDTQGSYSENSVSAAVPLAQLAIEPLRRWHAARAAVQEET
jgi:GAF domain-containing protein